MANEPKLPNIPKLSELTQSFNAIRNFELPKIERPQFVINAEQGVASEFHKRLTKWIQDFDQSLDDAHEVGI